MLKIILFVPLMVALSFSASIAVDDSIPVVPGNYSITTTTTSNMSTNAKTDTEEQCITDTSFNPSMSLPDDDSCTATNVQKSGNKLTYDVTCQGSQAMPSMTGKAEASTTSSTVNYKISMTGSFQGQDFSIKSNSEGNRTGACN